ncbi:MAG: peptidase S1 [Alphaproteobacteria bacterium]
MTRTGVLTFAVTLAAAPAALACPDYGLPSSFGSIVLYENFNPDPYVRNITAGGRYSLAGCFGSNQYTGSVAAKPDFEFQYSTSGSYNLTIMVQSGYDTMLLVNDPNGEWWFDDDSGGNGNPMITFAGPVSGVYDIWIGSYDGGRGLPGQLMISERY